MLNLKKLNRTEMKKVMGGGVPCPRCLADGANQCALYSNEGNTIYGYCATVSCNGREGQVCTANNS